MGLLDFLFPKRCIGCKTYGSYICPSCFASISFTDEMVCSVCNRNALDGITHPGCRTKHSLDGMLASTNYAGLMKKLIYQYKYQPYLTDLTKPLGELFIEGLIQKEPFMQVMQKRPAMLVPIPLHATKLRTRGYNQAYLLAKEVGISQKLPVVDCLARIKKTRSQYQLTRAERQENIHDAFVIKKDFRKEKLNGATVLLVDDVTTSGTTFAEAAKLLKKNGVKHVWGIALAHGS